MNLTKRVQTVFNNPGMVSAYSRWILRRSLKMPGPFINVQGNARIGCSWNGFSEYWSYHDHGDSPGNALSESITTLIASQSACSGDASVAFDVGANLGIFTTAFVAAGFSEVHAFEPVPATFSRLRENVAFNRFESRVKLNPLAVGEKEATAQIQYDSKSPATAHLVGGSPRNAIDIRVTTLDRYAEMLGIRRIDFLKIDVEGYESAVLKGAARLMSERRISLILLEWCSALLRRAGSSPEELAQIISGAGYALHALSSSNGIGARVDHTELQSISWDNLIAVPVSTTP